MNMSLSESERGMFDAVSRQQLKGMIETFRPDNHGRRDFMKMVAASTAAMAAGAVGTSCEDNEEDSQPWSWGEADLDANLYDGAGGATPDANYDSGWHPGADADADADSGTDAGKDAGMDASKDAEPDA